MTNIQVVLTTRIDLEFINVCHGMLLCCRDTRDSFYVNENKYRLDITSNVVLLRDLAELNKITSPILSRVYIVEETNKAYKYTNKWVAIETESDMETMIEDSIDFTPSVLYKDGEFYAPEGLATNTYLSDGTKLSAVLDNNFLTVTKTMSIYIEAEIHRQRVFNIPFPITNYNLCQNHMTVIFRGRQLESDEYVINNEKLILNSHVEPVQQGELLLFIFYYTTVLDLNDRVLLTTKNYEDLSITTEKLSPNIRLRATNILETATKFFLTKEEKDKLEGIDYGATRYIHPETHPAEMIVESTERKFISTRKLEELDRKAFAKDVYTKTEIETKIKELYDSILDSTPETLDTLKELAEALGNDPNFATTILTKLGEKATKEELKATNDLLDTKVNITDYTKAGIYNTPTKVRVIDVDHYNLKVLDPKLSEYIDGMLVSIKITDSNSGPSMIKINSLEPKPILTQDQYQLVPKELKEGSIYSLRYNGSTGNFILQGKGGVNLNTSTQNEYFADLGENISRGDLLDLINNKVRVSTPRFSLLSNHSGNSDKFNCDGDIKILPISSNKFILLWKEQLLLKTYVFNIDELTKFICNNKTSVTPSILNTDCKYFKTIQITAKKFIVIYCTSNNYITSIVININNLDEFSIGNSFVTDEVDDIENMIAVPLKDGKFMIGYQVLDKTKIYYLQCIDDQINPISNRINSNYPLNHVQPINNEQTLFLGMIDGQLKGWVLNIYDNEISYTTLSTITEGECSNIKSIQLDVPTQVYLTYTNTLQDKMYNQFLEVDYNGNIIIQPKNIIYNDQELVKSNLYEDFTNYNEEYNISVSNYSSERDAIMDTDNREYIKLVLHKLSRTGISVKNEYIVIDDTFTNMDIQLLSKNRVLLVYTNNTNKLTFDLFEIKKKPDMIAVSNGKENETIVVSEW